MKSENALKEKQALVLFDEYRNGSSAAFSALYKLYAMPLLTYGMCFTHDKELVKDCVHDVFVRLLVKSRGSNIKKLGRYLFISTRNRILDEYRRPGFSSDTPVTACSGRLTCDSAEAIYIRDEEQRRKNSRAAALLGELTPRQRTAFRLYFIEQRKYDEICGIMHMNYPCVRNLVHRGMQKMRASKTYADIKKAI